jgi:hypothetical protein
MLTERDELQGEILWFEALQDSIEDGQIEDALKAIEAAIALKRREMKDAEAG